jgi:hypothetical protein
LKSAIAPASNSIVVIAAVDPITKTTATPDAILEAATAFATIFVTSCASPCPLVAIWCFRVVIVMARCGG